MIGAYCLNQTTEFGSGYEQIALRINANAATETLASLLGFRPRGEIEFEPVIDYRHPRLQSFRKQIAKSEFAREGETAQSACGPVNAALAK